MVGASSADQSPAYSPVYGHAASNSPRDNHFGTTCDIRCRHREPAGTKGFHTLRPTRPRHRLPPTEDPTVIARLASLDALLGTHLQNLMAAETRQLELLADLRRAAHDETLAHCYAHHLHQTGDQIKRLERCFERLDLRRGDQAQGAIGGLCRECTQVLRSDAHPAVRDLALIACTQRIEHYEMAAYGAARTIAELSDLPEIADLLQDSLGEEGLADKHLIRCAGAIYPAAVRLGGTSDEAGRLVAAT